MIYQASITVEIKGHTEQHTIDTNILPDIKMDSNYLQLFENKDISYEIIYSLSHDEEKKVIVLTGRCPDIKGSESVHYDIDPIKFADEMSIMLRDKDLIENMPSIKAGKEEMIKHFCKQLLDNNGSLCVNSIYDCFAYIYANGEKVGTFETMNIINNSSIKISDYQSVIELPNLKDVYIDLFINNKIHFGMNISNIEDDILTITDTNREEVEIPKEILNLKPKNSFETEEDFLLDRRSLISISNEDPSLDLDLDLGIFDE